MTTNVGEGSGEQMIGRSRQRILVGAAIEVFTHQLFGGSVGHCSDRKVSLQSAR
jgi:hypothetical protein